MVLPESSQLVLIVMYFLNKFLLAVLAMIFAMIDAAPVPVEPSTDVCFLKARDGGHPTGPLPGPYC
jgi:hypothetical protein